jgi:hypothetical protein
MGFRRDTPPNSPVASRKASHTYVPVLGGKHKTLELLAEVLDHVIPLDLAMHRVCKPSASRLHSAIYNRTCTAHLPVALVEC